MAEADPSIWHGQCYGFETDRNKWQAPVLAVSSDKTARIGYDSLSAGEYLDTDEVKNAKAAALVRLLAKSNKCVLFTGAGLSTKAGIQDYASQEKESLSGVGGYAATCAPTSPFLAQPTYAHRFLVELWKTGNVYRWIQQNHDGLPQKAGLPQEAMNEIHGAWHSPANPVIPMGGYLRKDLCADMFECADVADLTVAIGTSISGLNADRVANVPAEKAAKGNAVGSVIIGLQQTVHDKEATLRIFAECDTFFAIVADLMQINVPEPFPEGTYFVPACCKGKEEEDYVFQGLPYKLDGTRSQEASLTLDLRDDAELVITNGMHAGARGIACGFDREGNVRCRFKVKPEKGKLRAQVAMLLGRWWIQAAVDGTVPQLPVVNEPTGECNASNGGTWIKELIDKYAV